MVEQIDDNQERFISDAVQQFIDAQVEGQEPDIEEFVNKYPGLEHQIRNRVSNILKIDSLFASLTKADESDFSETATGHDLTGQKIGNFEIMEMIGRGGMGVVYLAHDTKLDRSVAIKSMPAELVSDSTARMRFMREAKLLASLNHSNIAVIHEIIEEEQDSGYLVLEYIPGQTLTQKIAHKPLKLQEALSIGGQIAEAVSAAHENGVIHRDLKPGNIKITPEGKVKVLDFGLAKSSVSEDRSSKITVTQPGRVMGTPAYMSPEQARGKPTDRRSDIWSFGCVMYEMLTGQLPFEGETATDTLVCIIEREPDWEKLPQGVPMNIRTLLRRCLEKDPHCRLQHIGDARIEINETLSLPATAPPVTISPVTAPQSTRPRRSIVWAAACLILVALLASLITWNLTQPDSPFSQNLTRFVVHPMTTIGAEALWHQAVAISPDGKYLAFVDEGETGGRLLYLRDMDDTQARALPGTEGAISPFFSPDGEWIGFYDFNKRELKKIAITGGTPTTLCEPRSFIGAFWDSDDTIIFDTELGGLWRSSGSGEIEELTIPDANQGELWHVSPQVLPGGEAVLFTNRREDDSCMEVFLLETGQRRMLLKDGTAVRYVPTGHLVFARDETLYAAPFDIDELKVKGPALPVVEGISVSYFGSGQFAFSENGTLVYVPALSNERSLVWVDRTGVTEPVGKLPRPYESVQISPDGNHIAMAIRGGKNTDIWMLDKARLTHRQITFDGRSYGGIWTHDGKRVIFTFVPEDSSLSVPMWTLADGSSQAEPLADAKQHNVFWRTTYCLSPDGSYLLGGLNNIAVLPMEDEGDVRPFIKTGTPGFQRHPAFSPNGRWLAYDSTETGPVEVYIRPFPGPGGLTPISADGGYEPLWSRDGKELFYRNGDKMMVVTIETEPKLKVGMPRELFKGQFRGSATLFDHSYDLAPDGRFIMIREDEESAKTKINVVLNWFEELKRLVPTEKGE
jgi:serine/threonine-protein kinase